VEQHQCKTGEEGLQGMSDIASKPERIIFIFPHQDDEMMAFHRISYFLKHQKDLSLVWITDGAANSLEVRKSLLIRFTLPLLCRESDETIRQVRQSESSTLMKHLGISPENLKFLAFPSGQVKTRLRQIIQSLEKIFLDLQPQEIYTVPFDHGGFEHDICHAAARFAARVVPQARLYEFPVTNIYKGVLRIHYLIPLDGIIVDHTPFSIDEENQRLTLFRRIYKSQWFASWIESMANLLPSEYKRLGEPYRRMPDYDYSSQRFSGNNCPIFKSQTGGKLSEDSKCHFLPSPFRTGRQKWILSQFDYWAGRSREMVFSHSSRYLSNCL
jgi:LmbE family N-acetylglucosaminyl deacetylase